MLSRYRTPISQSASSILDLMLKFILSAILKANHKHDMSYLNLL